MPQDANEKTPAEKRWETRRARYGASGHVRQSAKAAGLLCSVPECGRPLKSNGRCSMHEHRMRRHGTLDRVRSEAGAKLAWIKANVRHQGDDCLVWPFPLNAHGRGLVQVEGQYVIASRYMCILAHGEPPTPEHEAAHSCGKGHLGCFHPGHLVWKTRVENLADKLVHDTHKRGERSWNAILTAQDVREIRALVGTMPQADIAARYGVARATIANIKRRAIWAWLD